MNKLENWSITHRRRCCATVETDVDCGRDDVEEDDQLGVMMCSLSSGFEDVSCASSELDADEMPSEETWNFDVHEEEQQRLEQKPADSEEFQSSGTAGLISEEQVRIRI